MPHVRKGVLDMNSDREIPGPNEYVYVKKGRLPAKKRACERTQIQRPQGYIRPMTNGSMQTAHFPAIPCQIFAGALIKKKTMFLIGDSIVFDRFIYGLFREDGVRPLSVMEKKEEDSAQSHIENFFILEKGKDLGHTVIYMKRKGALRDIALSLILIAVYL